MGLMDAIGSGIGQAAQGLADSSMEQIKAQIDQDRQAALMQMRAASELENAPKLEAARLDVQSKAADTERQKVGLIAQEAKSGIDPADSLKIMRAQADKYRESGYMKEADAIENRLDKLNDNELNKSYRDWQMKHGDETLAQNKEQAAENLKLQQQQIGIAAGKLNLDKQERKDMQLATEGYMKAAGNFSILDPKTTDPATYKAATVAKEMAAINLMKYGIKVGGDTNQIGRFQGKVVEDEIGGPKRQEILDTVTGTVSRPSAQPAPQDVRVGGKVIGQARTQEEANAIVAKFKSAK